MRRHTVKELSGRRHPHAANAWRPGPRALPPARPGGGCGTRLANQMAEVRDPASRTGVTLRVPNPRLHRGGHPCPILVGPHRERVPISPEAYRAPSDCCSTSRDGPCRLCARPCWHSGREEFEDEGPAARVHESTPTHKHGTRIKRPRGTRLVLRGIPVRQGVGTGRRELRLSDQGLRGWGYSRTWGWHSHAGCRGDPSIDRWRHSRLISRVCLARARSSWFEEDG